MNDEEEMKRLRAHIRAWEEAVYEAVTGNGIGRYGDAQFAVVTGEKLHELQTKAAKWDALPLPGPLLFDGATPDKNFRFEMQIEQMPTVTHTFTPVITYKKAKPK